MCHFCSKDADAEEVRFSGVRSDEEVVPPEEGDGLAAAPALLPVLGALPRRGMTKTENACRLLSPRVRWLLEGRKNGCAHVGATLSRANLWISVLKQSKDFRVQGLRYVHHRTAGALHTNQLLLT